MHKVVLFNVCDGLEMSNSAHLVQGAVRRWFALDASLRARWALLQVRGATVHLAPLTTPASTVRLLRASVAKAKPQIVESAKPVEQKIAPTKDSSHPTAATIKEVAPTPLIPPPTAPAAVVAAPRDTGRSGAMPTATVTIAAEAPKTNTLSPAPAVESSEQPLPSLARLRKLLYSGSEHDLDAFVSKHLKDFPEDMEFVTILLSNHAKKERLKRVSDLLEHCLAHKLEMPTAVLAHVLRAGMKRSVPHSGTSTSALESMASSHHLWHQRKRLAGLVASIAKEGVKWNASHRQLLLRYYLQNHERSLAQAIVDDFLLHDADRIGPAELNALSSLHIRAKDFASAVRVASRSVEIGGQGERRPVFAHSLLVAALARSGQLAEARAAVDGLDLAADDASARALGELAAGYLQFNRPADYQSTLERMVALGVRPSRSVLISLICQLVGNNDLHGAAEAARLLFKAGATPNVMTFTVLVEALRKSGNNMQATVLVDEMLSHPGLTLDPAALTAAVRLYAQVGQDEKVVELVESAAHVNMDDVAVTAFIAALSRCKRVAEARTLFDRMLAKGATMDVRDYTSLLNGYTRIEDFAEADAVWRLMRKNNISPDARAYSARVTMLAQSGQIQLLEETLAQMRAGGIPMTEPTYAPVLHALAGIGAVDLLRRTWADAQNAIPHAVAALKESLREVTATNAHGAGVIV